MRTLAAGCPELGFRMAEAGNSKGRVSEERRIKRWLRTVWECRESGKKVALAKDVGCLQAGGRMSTARDETGANQSCSHIVRTKSEWKLTGRQ